MGLDEIKTRKNKDDDKERKRVIFRKIVHTPEGVFLDCADEGLFKSLSDDRVKLQHIPGLGADLGREWKTFTGMSPAREGKLLNFIRKIQELDCVERELTFKMTLREE
jgi:hypothetical protein